MESEACEEGIAETSVDKSFQKSACVAVHSYESTS